MSREDGFTQSYLGELGALRKDGLEFAERFPKVAARLKLGEEGSTDPHVERLIESFAFLTARVQRKLDDDYPELSASLLEVLYPQLTRPVPSMAVVEVELDFEQSVPTSGLTLPRGTPFVSKPVRGAPLRFRSTAPLTLWPVRIMDAGVEAPSAEDQVRYPAARSAIRLQLRAEGEHPFGVLEIEQLRFFLRGDATTVAELYDLLLANVTGIEVSAGKRAFSIDPGELGTVGFSDDEAALPYPRRSFEGYRLLQEYFAFPAKFHFFDLGGLAPLQGRSADEIEIRFLLDREPRVPAASIEAKSFSLANVPIINLFETTADPVLLSPFTSEHLIMPDAQRPMDLEIFSVEEVVAVGTDGAQRPCAKFYSLGRGEHKAAAYWQPLRRPSRRKGDEGTDVSLALVDLDMKHATIADGTLHVKVVCTNRDLPHSSGQWGRDDDFRPEGVTGVLGARCVHQPTRAHRPSLEGRDQWKLVSHLALNYLSIVHEGRDALREILQVYDLTGLPANRDQIEGILDVRSEPGVRWLASRFGSGFGRGVKTTLVLDRERFVGASVLLFAGVIERFLALYCAINSFSELALETPQDQTEVYRWKPRAGERILL